MTSSNPSPQLQNYIDATYMFPSSNYGNPIPYTTDSFFKSPFTYNENPDSRQPPPNPPYFSHLPPTFLDDHHHFFFTHIMPQNHHLTTINTNILSSTTADPPPSATPPKKRKARKKDRHSKILTAQGLRDRRMRLPLEIANRFFTLQDALGFDRASKTIEWLYSKSNKAIEELIRNHPNTKNSNHNNGVKSESSISECEEESEEERKTRKLQKTVSGSLARESRDMARARARERTRQKMMNKLGFATNPHNLDQLGFFPSHNSPNDSGSHHHQLINYQKNADVSGGLDYNKLLCFLGNWDVEDDTFVRDDFPLTGNFQGQSPSSIFMATSSIHYSHPQEK